MVEARGLLFEPNTMFRTCHSSQTGYTFVDTAGNIIVRKFRSSIRLSHSNYNNGMNSHSAEAQLIHTGMQSKGSKHNIFLVVSSRTTFFSDPQRRWRSIISLTPQSTEPLQRCHTYAVISTATSHSASGHHVVTIQGEYYAHAPHSCN